MRDPICGALLHDYYVDVSDRWYQDREGRDSTPEEIEAGFPQMRSDDLAPPTGEFVVARRADEPRCSAAAWDCGCCRTPGRRVAELRRLYVRPEHPGAGLGAGLLLCAEEIARVWGVSAMRLDTRLDLGEARALYLRQGWVEVPAFSDAFYAEVWYAKPL